MTKTTKPAEAPGVLGGNPQDPKTIKQDLQDEKTFAELSDEQRAIQEQADFNKRLDSATAGKYDDLPGYWTLRESNGGSKTNLTMSELGAAIYPLLQARVDFSVHPQG